LQITQKDVFAYYYTTLLNKVFKSGTLCPFSLSVAAGLTPAEDTVAGVEAGDTVVSVLVA
jgi:hypothetical protein